MAQPPAKTPSGQPGQRPGNPDAYPRGNVKDLEPPGQHPGQPEPKCGEQRGLGEEGGAIAVGKLLKQRGEIGHCR